MTDYQCVAGVTKLGPTYNLKYYVFSSRNPWKDTIIIKCSMN